MIDMGDDFLNAKLAVKAKTIYHYTSMSTLPVFFEDKADLYCTNTECLNDPTEFSLGPYSFVDYLKEKGRIEEWQEKQLRSDLAKKLEETWVNNWVMSFSEAEDDLSQWRGYVSNDSGGYAIGFNTTKVVRALERLTQQGEIGKLGNIPLLTRCLYWGHDRDVAAMYDKIMEKYRKDFASYFAGHYTDSKIKSAVLGVILFATLPIKHGAFHSEKEARIIIPVAAPDYSKVRILGGKPRMPVGLPSLGEPLYSYFDKIYISPHGNSRALLAQVTWLKNKHNATFEIVRSRIPYDPSR